MYGAFFDTDELISDYLLGSNFYLIVIYGCMWARCCVSFPEAKYLDVNVSVQYSVLTFILLCLYYFWWVVEELHTVVRSAVSPVSWMKLNH